MRTGLITFAVCISLICTACSRGSAAGDTGPAATGPMTASGTPWQASDLLAGPVGIVKGVFAVPLCPMRLTSKTIDSVGSSSMSTSESVFEVVAMPIKAVIDGVFTGAAYIVGGAVDTVSGGALGLIENAEGEEQPATNVHCLMAGLSSDY